MLKIALTGNIASGKSIVLDEFKSLNLKTLCLDGVVHTIYDKNDDFKDKILDLFNTTKRSEISKIVFSDKSKLNELENLIYPFVIDEMNKFFNINSSEKIIIVDVPMLFEAGFDKYFDKIIFVSSKEDLRLQRLIKRNDLSESEAKIRINSQEKEDKKLPLSDYIIFNNSDLSHIKFDCKKIIEDLMSL